MNKGGSRKPIFFTSDQHYGHVNCLSFDKRPFKDIYHMKEEFIKRHNHIVPENGLTYHLGDFGMTNVDDMKDILSRLNGQHIFIRGNHDTKGDNAYYHAGFIAVLYNATLYIANERVTLSHCPLRGVFREDVSGMGNSVKGEMWHGEFRIKHQRCSIEDNGQFHLAGHTHIKPEYKDIKGKTPVKYGRQWDIGVVGNNGIPVSINAVEGWIARTKQEENK